MSVVAAELGVGTLQGGVSGGLRLLDAVKCQLVEVCRRYLDFRFEYGPVAVGFLPLVGLGRVL